MDKEQPSVQVEPKFCKGDKVRFKDSYYKEELHGKVGIIVSVNVESECYVEVDNTVYCARESDLEPYTESESRNLSQEIANCDKPEDNQLKDNMEEKELNLCERLKGCEGEEFYSLIDGDVKLKEINDNGVICQYHSYHLRGHLFGCSLDGVCQLYPSRALYEKYPLDAKKAWDEWASERKPKVKLHVSYEIIQGCLHGCGDFPTLEFCTDKEAKQAVEAVRECLMKFYKDNTQP